MTIHSASNQVWRSASTDSWRATNPPPVGLGIPRGDRGTEHERGPAALDPTPGAIDSRHEHRKRHADEDEAQPEGDRGERS